MSYFSMKYENHQYPYTYVVIFIDEHLATVSEILHDTVYHGSPLL